MGFSSTVSYGGGGGGGGSGIRGPHHNFVVIAPMIMKFGTGIKLDLFYTIKCSQLSNPLTDLAEIW